MESLVFILHHFLFQKIYKEGRLSLNSLFSWLLALVWKLLGVHSLYLDVTCARGVELTKQGE